MQSRTVASPRPPRRFLLLAMLAAFALAGAARAQDTFTAFSRLDIWSSTTRDFTDVALPGEYLEIFFYAGSQGNVLETGLATLTLPPEIQLNSWLYYDGPVKSIEVAGQTMTVEMDIDDHMGIGRRGGFEIRLYCRVKGLADLPDIAKTLEFPVSVSVFRPGWGNADDERVHEGQLAYSRLSVTADKSGPVEPGDIITFSINASGYPLEKFVSSRLTLQSAYNTDVVPGSWSGGGSVTESGNQIVVNWTDNPGGISGSYKVQVRQLIQMSPTADEVRYTGAHYRLVVERPAGGSRRTYTVSGPEIVFPLDRGESKVTLKIEAPTEGLELGEPFQAKVAVVTQTSGNVTVEFPDGALYSEDEGFFEIEQKPVSPYVLNPASAIGVTIPVSVTALETGVGTLRARISVTDSEGEVFYVDAEREIEIPAKGDLHIRESGQTPGEWRGDDFYRKTPVGPQLLEKSIALDGEFAFDVRLENDGENARAFNLKASETFGDDWDVVYVANGIGDVTTSIKSGSGIALNLEPGASQIVHVSMAPTLDTFSSQKSFTLTAFDADSPTVPSDSVEAIVKRSAIVVDATPPYPLVGHMAEVAVKFRNTTGKALSNLTALATDAAGVFDPQAAVEQVGDASEPASVATLNDGDETTFKFKFRMKSEGGARFVAVVKGEQNGEAYQSPVGLSDDLEIGKVAIESFELVQTLPDKPLIAGKRAGALVTLSNTTPVKQKLSWTTELSGDYARVYTVADGLELAPGESEHLLPTSDTAGDKFVTIKGSAATWKLTLFGADESVEDYDGRSADFEQGAPKFIVVNIEPAVAVFPSSIQAGISVAVGEAITQRSIAYLNAALPIGELSSYSPTPISIPATPDSIVAERNYNLIGLGRFVERAAVFSSVTRIVLLSPDDERFWGPGVDGIVLRDLDRVALIRARPDLAAGVAAHEIGHSYGLEHYTGGAPVAKGFRIGPDEAEILKDMPDLMRATAGADMWISSSEYDFMMGAMSGDLADPEMVVISGVIGTSGVVTADAWYTVWTDQVTELSDEGAYSVAMLDAEGETLLEHRFDPTFELEVILSEDATEEPDLSLSASPFVFSMPRHENLNTIRILKGATVLYERALTPNAPAVAMKTQLAGSTFEAGDAIPIAWTATDPDGGALVASLEWSKDGGASWSVFAIDLAESSFDWTAPDASARSCWIRLRVSDGLNTTTVNEGPFEIAGSEPGLVLDVGGNAVIGFDAPAGLDASGSYATDGAALTYQWRAFAFPGDEPPAIAAPAAAATAWTPSGPGEYIFELVVSDAAGRTATAYKRIVVTENASALAAGLSIRRLPGDRFEIRWPEGLLVDLERSADLAPDSWQAILSGARSENGERILTLDGPALRQFFRLRAK